MNSIVRHVGRSLTPFRLWIGDLRDPKVVRADMIAGVTVALVLVPQSMAYAQLAGLPMHIGLYAAFLPVMVAAVFGSSRQLATGPVAVVSLMTAAALGPIVAASGLSGPEAVGLYIALAALLALLVGLIQVTLGLLRLGLLVDFLSLPVVVGFTNGAAIIIATSQLDKVFGVERPLADYAYEQVWGVLVNAASDAHLTTLLMAVTSFAIMLALPRYLPRVPEVLTAVAATTLLAWAIDFQGIGGKVVGEIPVGLPGFKAPTLDLEIVRELAAPALLISLIGFMEAISIAKAMAVRTRQRLDPSQELVGQGLSNIVAGVFQGYPVSGSFSRSAVKLSAGAVTGFSSVTTAVVVAATLLFLTPLLYHLPLATLAAVIIVAVVKLIRVAPIREALKVQPMDGVVAILTLILVLVLAPQVELAIVAGVLLSLAAFLYRSMRPRFSELSLHHDGRYEVATEHDLPTCQRISLLRFEGPLYFASAGHLESRVLENVASKPGLKFVVLDAGGINEVDATGIDILRHLAERLHLAGIDLQIARANQAVMDTFERAGFVAQLGADHFVQRCDLAIERGLQALGVDAVRSPLRQPVRPKLHAAA